MLFSFLHPFPFIYGFHEDGLKAGLAAATQLLADARKPGAVA